MRFSLRTLFLVTLAVALLCGVLFVLPGIWSLLALCIITLNIPPAAVAGIVYFRGHLRAFSIGVLSGFCSLMLSVALSYAAYAIFAGIDLAVADEVMSVKVFIVTMDVTFLLGGLVAVAIRSLAMRQQKVAKFKPPETSHALDTEDQP